MEPCCSAFFLYFFFLSCPRRMQGVKPVLVKMTGEVRNIFWEKEEDKKIVWELLIQSIRQLIWASYSYKLDIRSYLLGWQKESGSFGWLKRYFELFTQPYAKESRPAPFLSVHPFCFAKANWASRVAWQSSDLLPMAFWQPHFLENCMYFVF